MRRLSSASASSARSRVAKPCRSASKLPVMSVGQNAPMPCRRHSSATVRTCSAVSVGELKLMPRQPLICRSKNAGATHSPGLAVGRRDGDDAAGSVVTASGSPVA